MKKPGVRIAELSYTIGIEMNEKIRELEKQCWSHYIDGVLIDGHLHFDVQKFTDLVAGECARISESDAVGDDPACCTNTAHRIAGKIKRHFGLE